MKKILVPTDLTEVAAQATSQAAIIAKKANAGLTLLHVLDSRSAPESTVTPLLKEQANNISLRYRIECDFIVNKGNIFETIPAIARSADYFLIVIGTHGIKGIKQILMGANILKLVMKIGIPVMVVQKETPLIESFDRMILPVSSHDSFKVQIEAATLFASLFNTEIHLYSIHKAGYEWPEQLKKNIEDAARIFESRNIRMKRVKEEQNVYSVGYAKQTLKYAESVSANLISIMSVSSTEYYYFAQLDKESMLLNEPRIPILCCSGLPEEEHI